MDSIKKVDVVKITDRDSSVTPDILAVEEPMEIRLEFQSAGKRATRTVSVTMRTPGSDTELALGFLFTEGIISSQSDVLSATHISPDNKNVILVRLADSIVPSITNIERNFYTTSSCGVCGKASIEAVFAACPFTDTKDDLLCSPALLEGLPVLLRNSQKVFEHTGGLHGCALFSIRGEMLMSREDVGRHNALDKLIGAAFTANTLPLQAHILLLSGRASFELVQKAAMAGIKIVAAVGAPSSLAVQMAEEWDITLIGFLREERFNIYSGGRRISLDR